MNLANGYIDTKLSWDDGNINTVVFEEQSHFVDNIRQFYLLKDKQDASWIFSAKSSPLVLGDDIDIMIDFINIDVNGKRIMNGVSKQVQAAIARDNFCFQRYYADGYKLLSDLLLDCMPNVDLNDTVDPALLFKLFAPRLNCQGGTVLEQLVGYVDAIIEFTSIKILVCVGLKNYLDYEEFEQFVTHVIARNFPVLCIENSQKYNVKNEKVLIIDCDLCEIVL